MERSSFGVRHLKLAPKFVETCRVCQLPLLLQVIQHCYIPGGRRQPQNPSVLKCVGRTGCLAKRERGGNKTHASQPAKGGGMFPRHALNAQPSNKAGLWKTRFQGYLSLILKKSRYTSFGASGSVTFGIHPFRRMSALRVPLLRPKRYAKKYPFARSL